MSAFRRRKLETQLAQRLSELILFELSDAQLGTEIISITRVEVTPDYFKAAVYFTLLRAEYKNRVLKALYRAAPRLQHFLYKRMRIGKLPQLQFFYDHTTLRRQEQFAAGGSEAEAAATEIIAEERRRNN